MPCAPIEPSIGHSASPPLLRIEDSWTNLGTTASSSPPPSWSQWHLDTWVPEWRTGLVQLAELDHQPLGNLVFRYPPTNLALAIVPDRLIPWWVGETPIVGRLRMVASL